MEIKIVNQSPNPLPLHQTEHAAGIDLMAFLPEPIVLEPMQRALIPTGLFIEIPPDYEAQIRPRSGLALKHGITVLNSPGTIDADYRGEVKVLLINFGEESFIISNGERIAQMVVSRHETILWKPVADLAPSNRGEGGYGSTGK
ncbi:MAG: dUTP diphosphatase [Bacteroidota bacterium]|nr:dUTP diphosphatase [Bacteroidota bacterium]